MKPSRVVPVLLPVLLLIAPPARAQTSVGAYGLLNMADLSGDAPDRVSYSGKTGFDFGLIGEFHLGDDVWLSLQPGVHSKGAGIEVRPEGEEEPARVADASLRYLSLPVQAKFVTVGGKVYVISGVNLSLLTSAEIQPEEGGEPSDVKDSFRDFDLAVDFGIGGQLPVGSIRVLIEARYEQGILNIVEDTIVEDALRSRLRTRGLQLLAGVLLPLGGAR